VLPDKHGLPWYVGTLSSADAQDIWRSGEVVLPESVSFGVTSWGLSANGNHPSEINNFGGDQYQHQMT